MSNNKNSFFNIILMITIVFCLSGTSAGQVDEERSIGGEEHDLNVYGVQIGMDVPTALKAVFVNAERKPGEEKPDALRREGPDKKDIRVLYNDLPKGQLQIVFAEGKFVKEIILTYEGHKKIFDLRLPSSGDINVAATGERFDDRYTIGFLDSKKQQKLWWRDVKTADDYRIRLAFLSESILKDGNTWWQKIIQKAVTLRPGDEKKFLKAMKSR